jgi:hypothetical protein
MLFVFVPFALAFADFIDASSIARQDLTEMTTLHNCTFRGCQAILSRNAIARYLGTKLLTSASRAAFSRTLELPPSAAVYGCICVVFSVNETYGTNLPAGIQWQEKYGEAGKGCRRSVCLFTL